MSRKQVLLFAIAFLLGSGVAYLFFFREAPAEKAIQQRFLQLQSIIQKDPGESGPVLALKNEQLSRIFAEDVVLKGNIPFLAGRHSAHNLGAMIMQLRMQADSVSLGIRDLQIELVHETEAQVTFTAQAVGRGKRDSSQRYTETRDMRARLVKSEDHWRFAEFEAIKETER